MELQKIGQGSFGRISAFWLQTTAYKTVIDSTPESLSTLQKEYKL
jgi:hypothetical protein